jgi:hypothetical protein
MTRPLRRAHRAVWLALATTLPWLLSAALAVRRDPAPPNPQIHWSAGR